MLRFLTIGTFLLAESEKKAKLIKYEVLVCEMAFS